MLQTKIKEREIQLFIDLVRDNCMNATFLQLLEKTCCCPMGIDVTQRLISVNLFGKVLPERDVSKFRTADSAHSVLLKRAEGERRSSIALVQPKLDAVIINLIADRRAISKVLTCATLHMW